MPSRKCNKLARASALVMTFFSTTAGMNMFRDSPEKLSDLEVVAATIFRMALLVLLWRTKLYPRSLEVQEKYRQFIIEYFVATFTVETLQADFWFTLSVSVRKGLMKFVEIVDNKLQQHSVNCGVVCEFMRSDFMSIFVVYTLSLFFFLSAMYGAGFLPARDLTFECMLEMLMNWIEQIKSYFPEPKPNRRDCICPVLPPFPPPGDDSDDPCADVSAAPVYRRRSDTEESDRDRSSDFEMDLQ